MELENNKTNVSEKSTLDDYRSMETRLYGEIVKSCRSYSTNLNIISILGILDIVKQEIQDLEKDKQRMMKEGFPWK